MQCFHTASSLTGALKVALKRKEFVLHYQPIVDLQTGQWVGAEALIRWLRPTGEMVPPDVFIKAAEETGMIRDITAQVIAMVGHDAPHFFARYPDFHIAINLSTADLESHATVEKLARLRQQIGARPGNLMVEATERGLMKADIVQRILSEIRSLDIYVAIDDFGTGYSSLSYLEKFDLDYLKIRQVVRRHHGPRLRLQPGGAAHHRNGQVAESDHDCRGGGDPRTSPSICASAGCNWHRAGCLPSPCPLPSCWKAWPHRTARE